MKTTLAIVSILFFTSCASLTSDPAKAALVRSAATALIATVVENNPETRVIFELLSASLTAGVEPDYSSFADANVAIAVATLGDIAAIYAEDPRSELLAEAINRGLNLVPDLSSNK
tara:strand:+ start:484 stop:831 length:348 start_codon:yes stop_codon:yes gene_type:complete